MGFIQPLMKVSNPGQESSPKGISPQHPVTERHVTQRPELIGGLPLWLISRASRVLSQLALPHKPKPKNHADSLREIADIVEASDEELIALRAHVSRLQRALDARVGGSTEKATSDTCLRLFTELCRVQTRFTRAERQLGEVRQVLKSLERKKAGFQDDLVMVSIAFLALLVTFFGYVAEGSHLLQGTAGGV